MTAEMESTLRILIVDDDQDSRALLSRFLDDEGVEILTATNGAEGVELFERDNPSVVLMDVMMPVMDGYEAARRIKAIAGERFVPLIFLTAVSDDKALARCLEYGGDDFLTKPYSRVILHAKMNALRRTCQLYQTVQQQRDKLVQHEQRLLHEHEVAEQVFTRILDRGRVKTDEIRFHSLPAAISNGDLLLADRQPDGSHVVMVGDFTGHGLAAALGALPVSQLFHSLVARGSPLTMIVTQLNDMLHEILPTGMFCASTLLLRPPRSQQIEYWTGGLPDMLLHKASDNAIERFNSHHFPLGVLRSSEAPPVIEQLNVSPGDRIYIYTDGVVEARNCNGEMFGQKRLLSALGIDINLAFSNLKQLLDEFRDLDNQEDDITMMELIC